MKPTGLAKGVSINPGAMQFTRMLCGANSTAIILVIKFIAAFVSGYIPRLLTDMNPEAEDKYTIDPFLY